MVLFNYPLEYISKYFSGGLSWFDKLATYLRFNFFGDKTFSVFSLLFGFGIGMQFIKNKTDFASYHTIRMLLLLLIGIVHALVFWYGDILSLYAILGLVSMLLIRLPHRYLIIASGLIFLWPTIQTVLIRNGVIQFNFGGQDTTPLGELIELNTLKGITGHLKYNASQIIPTIQFYISGTLYHSLSMIILGVALGKKGIIFQIDQQIKKYWKLFYITGTIIIAWNLYQIFFFDLEKMSAPSQFYVYWILFNLSLVGQTFFVVATLIILLKTNYGYKVIKTLRYLGRMSLTNYLLHSLLGLFTFKVLRLYGQSSPGIDLLLAIVFTLLQIIFSKVWLTKYSIGPIESIWRRASKNVLERLKRAITNDKLNEQTNL